MRFVDYLREERVVIRPSWSTFDDTVAGLVGLMVADGSLRRADEAAALLAIRTREREASTAVLEIGIGIPHARVASVARPVVALGVSPAGFYEAVPTVRIRIVGLLLSPPAAGDEHLRLLAGMATLLRSQVLRDALITASNAAAVLDALGRHDRSAP
jgi:mannitol/fructose-specific phosphotransferase system IIA component (Ntr-type)